METQQGPRWGEPGYVNPHIPPRPKTPRSRVLLATVLAVAGLLAIGTAVDLLGGGDSGTKTAAPAPTVASVPSASVPMDTTPDVTEPPVETPLDLAVGDAGSFTSDEGDADNTVTKFEATKAKPEIIDGERFGLLVPKHGWNVVVHVKAAGTSGSYDFNSFDFYVKSSNGFHTEDPEYMEDWGPSLDSGTLHAGEHLSGTIVYDVPTRHGKLVYAPNYGGEPLATWSF
jgi:Domain of unknown function (DUF4352)